MFKKGDYIVITGFSSINDEMLPSSYCYKQRIDDHSLRVEKDKKGVINSWDIISIHTSYWRYATQEEATEYERIGKPYDVTTLQTNNKLVKGQVYYSEDTNGGGWWAISRHLEENNKTSNNAIRADYSSMLNADYFYNKSASWCYKSSTRTYRLASEEEIEWLQACEKAGKLIPKKEALKKESKFLVGRYLKCLKDNAICIPSKKGDYLLIVTDSNKENGDCKNITSGDTTTTNWGWQLPHKDLELMPEGFQPKVKETTGTREGDIDFKIGDWVVFDVEKAKELNEYTSAWNLPYILKVSTIRFNTMLGFTSTEMRRSANTFGIEWNLGDTSNSRECFRRARPDEIPRSDSTSSAEIIQEYIDSGQIKVYPMNIEGVYKGINSTITRSIQHQTPIILSAKVKDRRIRIV